MAGQHPARTALFSLEQLGIKLGLDQIRALVAALGRPDRAFSSIIVAGTNGKGSVTAMIERGLRAAGIRTGRFTSPHLVRLEERFAIDGASIGEARLDALAERVLLASRALPAPPSFFEATTAIALEAFRDAGVDVAVLEVGLGGRLDATNVVDSVAEVITMIDFDHQQYLGHTLDAIAREKAGVIKAGSVVILGENPPRVEEVMVETTRSTGARLIRAWTGTTCAVEMREGHAHLALTTLQDVYPSVTLALAGRHQVQNAVTAVRALEALPERLDRPIGPAAIVLALEDVEWPARLETRQAGGITMLIDGAHNPAGATALAHHVLDTFGHPLPMVVGVMRDKDLESILRALASAASVMFCTAPRSARAATPSELATVARSVDSRLDVVSVDDPLEAVRRAASRGLPVVVAGSLYLAGQIREELS
ncbi:MAG: folylpolyglutamate synthase/dihydrofolate synthase family protein [Acidobacteriota bacterium]